MEIYLIYINSLKKSQHKSFEDAFETVNNLIITEPNSVFEIFCEDYCDYGQHDTSCKIDLLLKYIDGKINKYI
jgi:hypothetical protein